MVLLLRVFDFVKYPLPVIAFIGATTLSIATLGTMTFSIRGFYVTVSINDTQYNNIMLSVTMLSVTMLSVAFYLLLC
jgi:hypothetical protein